MKNKIQRIREQNDLTRKDLSHILSCSVSHICNLEKGQARLSDSHRFVLTEHFDLDPNYFNNETQKPTNITERNKIIGENIKFHRKKAGVTQAILAEELGYAQNSVISSIERGIRSPSKEKMIQIADFFGINVAELFADTKAVGLRDTDVLVNKFIYIVYSKHKSNSLKAITQLINSAYTEIKEKERHGE